MWVVDWCLIMVFERVFGVVMVDVVCVFVCVLSVIDCCVVLIIDDVYYVELM